jgi:hypothetical protein
MSRSRVAHLLSPQPCPARPSRFRVQLKRRAIPGWQAFQHGPGLSRPTWMDLESLGHRKIELRKLGARQRLPGGPGSDDSGCAGQDGDRVGAKPGPRPSGGSPSGGGPNNQTLECQHRTGRGGSEGRLPRRDCPRGQPGRTVFGRGLPRQYGRAMAAAGLMSRADSLELAAQDRALRDSSSGRYAVLASSGGVRGWPSICHLFSLFNSAL